MCNGYWDLYECRWQQCARGEVTASGSPAEGLVPEPRAEAAPLEAPAGEAAPVAGA